MAGETTTSTPNFFVLLGLNPDDPWDDKKFEQVITEKRSEWSKKSSSFGAVALEAKKNLALITEIRKVMLDPTARAAQMADAKKVLAADRSEKIADFERQLAIAEGKGFLEKAELDKLFATFKGVLSEKEMRGRVKVPIQDESAGAKENQQLDQSTIKDITDKLRIVGKADLYDLLSRPKTTSNQELCNAASALYDEMQHRQPKTSEVTATSDLAGKAKTIFKTDDTRRKYNESLRQSSLNAILEEFEKTVNIGSKDKQKGLYEGQVTLFLEKAASAGWSAEEAYNRLTEFAMKHKWFLRVATMDINTQKQRCGYCHELNEKGREFCSKCNKELSIVCPDCGQKARSDEVGCGKCGFPVGNRFWVDEVLSECQYLLSQQELSTADTQLKLVEGAWTPKKADVRRQRIQEYRAQIQRGVQEQQKSVAQLQDYIRRHQFFAAQAYLAQQQPTAIADRETYLRTIRTEIAQARELFTRAKASTGNIDQRIELCVQALRICTDFKDARDLLSTMPPSAPKNLQSRLGGATVSLQWNPSPTRGAQYTIVRKTRSQPVSAKDGQTLETVSGYMYDDTNPEIGVPTFYAVFATLEGVVSVDAATLQQPVMLLQDVQDVSVQVDSQLVNLSWQAPPNMYNVLVVRKEKVAPSSITDGMRLSALDATKLVDNNVKNNTQYFYTVFAQFKNYSGQIVNAPGFTVQVIPESPPSPINLREVGSTKTLQGYEVRLNWDAPVKGHVAILKSSQRPQLKAGEKIDRRYLRQHGELLSEQQVGSLTDEWQQPGIAWYTPLVIFQNMAYIGQPRRVDVLDDVTSLKYQNLGTSLRLNWLWPANCNEVIVAYGYDGWPQLEGATANSQKVTRAEYSYLGYYDIRSSINRDLYIVVAAVVRQGSEQIIGSGAKVQARLASKIVVSYEIKTSGGGLFGKKKRLLHISARTPGTLPTLLLMSKVGRLPLRKEEGEPLQRFEGPVSIEKELEFELPERSFAPKTFGKLYLEDDSLYDGVTIHHPGEDKLRLS